MVRHSHAASWVDVIEACYELDTPEPEWLAQILRAARPLFPESVMLHGMTYDASVPAQMRVESLVAVQLPPGVDHAMFDAGARASQQALPPEEVARGFWVTRAETASELLGSSYDDKLRLNDIAGPFGIRDTLGINAPDPDHRGVALVASLGVAQRVPGAKRALLLRVASHLSAAFRLRRGTSRPAAALRPEHGEAVFDRRGKLIHATGAASGRAQRVALENAARVIVAAGGTQRASEAEVVEAWRALVEGRWSVVSSGDVDGKRFFVAVENGVNARPDARLSPRERAVLALVSIGHTNKLIAYDLGLSSAGVARALLEAQRKLGFRTRTELVAFTSALTRGTAQAQ